LQEAEQVEIKLSRRSAVQNLSGQQLLREKELLKCCMGALDVSSLFFVILLCVCDE